jgi:cytochrome c553
MYRAFLVLAAFGTITIAAVSCSDRSAKATTSTEPQATNSQSLVERGNYLVSSIGCDDCHSPKTFGPKGPEIDMEHRLSGYPADRPLQKVDAAALKNGWMLFGADLTAAVGPWGVSFAANITSDSTGIGNWTEAQFIKAIREGKSKGLDANRPLLPPMPWPQYRNLTDEDLRAIFAYLKSTKPVHNVVPEPKPLAAL